MHELKYINPEDVVVTNRQRTRMDKKKLNELCESMMKVGQLQPGVCRLDDEEQVHLIVGERRLKACMKLGREFTYICKDDLTDELLIYEAELMENLCREDLCWQDEVTAKQKLHQLRQDQYGATQLGVEGGHKLKDTADELGESVGIVTEDIELAMFAEAIPEVADAKNKTEAKKIVKRLKTGLKRKEALDEALGKSDEEEQSSNNSKKSKDNKASDLERRLAEYDRRSILGDLHKVYKEIETPDGYGVVLFDPPWGVEVDSVARRDGKKKKYEDSVEKFQKDLEKHLKILWNLMAENSHLYMFFGIVNHQFVYDTLEKVGFQTNRMPLIWYKKGAHTTRNPKVWPGRCYEPIAYARKGLRKLQIEGAPDIISTSPPTPKMKGEHPSAKHPDIYRELLRRSAFPGDSVLDPMAGAGMSSVACESLRSELALNWFTIELDDDYRNLQLYNLVRGYEDIVGDLAEFKGKVDYKNLVPGSNEWKAAWKKADEETQQEMLEWRQKIQEETA